VWWWHRYCVQHSPRYAWVGNYCVQTSNIQATLTHLLDWWHRSICMNVNYEYVGISHFSCMERVYSEDVHLQTPGIQAKLSRLSDIKDKTREVNCDIDSLKSEIKIIKAKRKAANVKLDREIRDRNAVLRSRQRRYKELLAQYERLRVYMKMYIICCNMFTISTCVFMSLVSCRQERFQTVRHTQTVTAKVLWYILHQQNQMIPSIIIVDCIR